MIYNMEEYEDFIRSLLKKIPVLRTDQLELALRNTYEEIDSEFAQQILGAIQRRGYLCMSVDGWSMTKGAYQRITDDRFMQKFLQHGNYKIPEMDLLVRKSAYSKELISCFWIALDMLPESINFITGSEPWQIVFDTSGASDEESQGKLYQITCIPKGKEHARAMIFEDLPKISDKDMQKKITRIAVIEDEKYANLIPHIGFSFICTLDSTLKRRFRIIEKREGNEVWGN